MRTENPKHEHRVVWDEVEVDCWVTATVIGLPSSSTLVAEEPLCSGQHSWGIPW